MSLQGRCIVCAHSLKIPHRSDAQYCGSTCRVRAFRASRQPRSGQHGSRRAKQQRIEGATTQTQLAVFRELRQARKQAADLREQLANQARTTAALESKLSEMATVALAQRDVLAQTTERLKVDLTQRAELAAVYAELQRNTRLVEDAREQSTGALMSALQLARDKAAASEAERETTLALVQKQLDEERRRSASLREQLTACESELQAERVQLDELGQSLSQARAAASQFVAAEKFSAVAAELSTVKQLLAERTNERDEARQAARVAVVAAHNLDQKARTAEAEVVKKDALLKDLGPKLQKAYAQLLLIKEKRDWRL